MKKLDPIQFFPRRISYLVKTLPSQCLNKLLKKLNILTASNQPIQNWRIQAPQIV